MVSGFWSSQDGRRLQWQQRRLRTAHVLVEQEPRQKGPAARREAKEFRSLARAQLSGQQGWPRPRAELALDLTFATTTRQPPTLARLPKNYLDLLGTNAADSNPGPLLYNDDGAVGMLFASAHNLSTPETGQHPTPYIHVVARTRADALADMALAHEILTNDGPTPRWSLSAEVDEDYRGADQRETIAWLRRQGDPQATATAELLAYLNRQQFQRNALERNDAALTDLLLGGGYRLITGDDPDRRRLQRLRRRVGERGQPATVRDPILMSIVSVHEGVEYRDMLLGGLGAVTLPPLPTAAGDSAVFKRRLDATLAQYAGKRPWLFPLLEPLRVTVLVIPPRRHAHSAKDLDNILIDVLSGVDKNLKPPADPAVVGPPDSALDSATAEGQRHAAERAERRARLRALGETAIWSYQVLELARHADDPPEGSLLLILGHGMNMSSVWDEAEQYLDDYFGDSER